MANEIQKIILKYEADIIGPRYTPNILGGMNRNYQHRTFQDFEDRRQKKRDQKLASDIENIAENNYRMLLQLRNRGIRIDPGTLHHLATEIGERVGQKIKKRYF